MTNADLRPTSSSRRFYPSIGQTLSLLTAAVVLTVLAIGVFAIRFTVTSAALEDAQLRMARGVRQLSSVSATGIRQAQARYVALAHDPAIQRALVETPRDSATANAAARTALLSLRSPNDSGMPIELWRAEDGRRLALVGDDVSSPTTVGIGGEAASPNRVLRPGLDSLVPRDSLQVGQLYSRDNHVYFWTAFPVVESNRAVAFILKQGRISTNPQTDRTIQELSGDSVTGYYRNVDGTGWTTFGGAVAGPPIVAGSRHVRPDLGEMIFSESRIPGTQLVLVMTIPKRVVLAGATSTIRKLAAFAVLLTVLAALLAWFAGHRVARPLVALTRAAEGVARGDYGARVEAAGS